MAVPLPTDCNASLVLAVNAKTSVAGFVQVGVLAPSGGGAATYIPYRLCNADPLRGNMLSATASWGGGVARALPGNAGTAGAVQLEVVLVAAKLFSLQFRCEAAPET